MVDHARFDKPSRMQHKASLRLSAGLLLLCGALIQEAGCDYWVAFVASHFMRKKNCVMLPMEDPYCAVKKRPVVMNWLAFCCTAL